MNTRQQARAGLSLVAPAVIAMVLLTIVPVIVVVQRALSPSGLSAFATMFSTPDFGSAMLNTAIWTIAAVVGGLIVGYAAALVLQSKHIKLAGLWRSALMIPFIIPGVVGVSIWKWSYSRDFGLINHYLQALHVIRDPIDWLSNPSVVLYALVVVQLWSTSPFVMLMASAGLQSIPQEQYEAARIDGAGGWQILRHITLPALRSTTAIATLTLAIFALNAFTIIWVATRGGPANASTILPVLLFQAFQNGDQPTVTALALIQLAISLAFAMIYVRVQRSELEEK